MKTPPSAWLLPFLLLGCEEMAGDLRPETRATSPTFSLSASAQESPLGGSGGEAPEPTEEQPTEPENECARVPSPCGGGSDCMDELDGFSCQCQSGYALLGGECTDLNECSLGSDACALGALCENLPGNHGCACPESDAGDGLFCLKSDPCSAVDCGAGTCEVIPDGAVCHCPAGQTGNCCEESCDSILFADDALDVLVREQLNGGQTGSLPESLLAESSLVSAPFAGETIETLSGLECFVGLTRLELPDRGIKDISALAQLHRLEVLDLGCSDFIDLAFLRARYRLQRLNLSGERCSESSASSAALDLAALGSLLQLQELDLSSRTLQSLAPLEALRRLRRLVLNDVATSSWESLLLLPALEEVSARGLSDAGCEAAEKTLTALATSGVRVDSDCLQAEL